MRGLLEPMALRTSFPCCGSQNKWGLTQGRFCYGRKTAESLCATAENMGGSVCIGQGRGRAKPAPAPLPRGPKGRATALHPGGYGGALWGEGGAEWLRLANGGRL